MKQHLLIRIVRAWVPLAVGLTVLLLVVYIIVQQVLRLDGNNPQQQMAEDAASALASGASPSTLIQTTSVVDPTKSLAPFLIIYKQGSVQASDMEMDGAVAPTPPSGIFTFVDENGMEKLTWQPQANARIAAVVIKVSGQSNEYVLAGRSLREIEDRESLLGLQILAGWVGTLVATLAAVIVAEWTTTKVRA